MIVIKIKTKGTRTYTGHESLWKESATIKVSKRGKFKDKPSMTEPIIRVAIVIIEATVVIANVAAMFKSYMIVGLQKR